jgi:hypothetical protein
MNRHGPARQQWGYSLSHDESPSFLALTIVQSILIQLVVLMEVQPKTPITLTPNNA